jgi:hypothetical protein
MFGFEKRQQRNDLKCLDPMSNDSWRIDSRGMYRNA